MKKPKKKKKEESTVYIVEWTELLTQARVGIPFIKNQVDADEIYGERLARGEKPRMYAGGWNSSKKLIRSWKNEKSN